MKILFFSATNAGKCLKLEIFHSNRDKAVGWIYAANT